MRRFRVKREEDESGVSGTGVVAEGVEFENGKVALQWLSNKASFGIYDNIKQVRDIHGHGGKTRISWVDPDPLVDVEEVEPKKNGEST